MRDNLFKWLLQRTVFRNGAQRIIRFGPLRGLIFRVSPITGLSPWYSGVERDVQDQVSILVRPGDVVIDVGANWGLHTLLFAQIVGARGKVIALEPNPVVFAELEWHIRRNNFKNVIALQQAVSDQAGTAQFVQETGYSQGKLSDLADSFRSNSFSVATQSLDNLVEELELNHVELIKVDVEGAESQVLKGAESVTNELEPSFIVELHAPEQDVFVGQWFQRHGYSLRRLSGPPIKRTDVGWPDPEGVWGTVVARPSR